MKTLFIILFCSIVFFMPPLAQASGNCETYKAASNQILRDLNDDFTGKAGFVVALACDGKLISHLEVGDAVIGKEKLRMDTPIYLASLAKQFTAALALQLVEEGVLSLDDSPTKFLDNLPNSYRKVTLWHLLTHTSGIPDYFSIAEEKGLDIRNNADVYHLMISDGKLDFAPGTDVAYSNSAFVLIAEMIEVATGQGYGYLLNERIFKPLKMELAWVNEPGTKGLSPTAMGYETTDQGLIETTVLMQTYGAGGIFMTMDDYLKWDRELIKGKILSEFVRAKMLEPATLSSGDLTPFSPGWIAGEIGGGILVGKNVQQAFGDLGGYRAGVRRFPKYGLTLVWFANNGVHLFDADIAEKILVDED